jgi:alkylated DNA repair dioxygenase AlkB
MSAPTVQSLDLLDAEVLFYPDFFPAEVADRLLGELLDTTAWKQETFKLYGKDIPFPRLTAWYGDEGAGYSYSGIKNVPLPWTAPLLEIRRAVDAAGGVAFNSVLLNRYRTGQDGVSWHADDEPEFGVNPPSSPPSASAAPGPFSSSIRGGRTSRRAWS